MPEPDFMGMTTKKKTTLKRETKKKSQKKRTGHCLNKISKEITNNTVKEKSIIFLGNLKGIRRLCEKGDGQGNNYRRRLDGWHPITCKDRW